MSIFDRINTILRANINDLLNRAEDPEVMLNQIIRDMADQINQARGQVANMLAQQKEIEAELNDAKNNSTQWGSKAEMAVKAGKDDLAREALQRKNDYDNQVNVFSQQLETQTATVNHLKDQLQQLQDKYDSTVRNKDVLIERHQRAQATQQMTQAATSLNNVDYSSDLSRMEQRINSEEAHASANAEMATFATPSSVDDRFSALQSNSSVDAELAAMKQRLGMGGSNGSAGSSSASGSSSSEGAPTANLGSGGSTGSGQ
jgi:phage shock protein A